MSYQVLARKWRPRIFADVVGQDHVVRALANALDNDRLHHAYLFTGTRGVGKTTLARIFAKSLNCEQGVGSQPCGVCTACREIDEGRFVDLLEVDAASRTKVDQTRELLENVPYAPVRGRYKVYLIDEVHMFSDSSFNALLKTLEEPPPHVKFLLATTDPQKVPVTVLSRCLQFNLKRLTLDQIEAQLARILEDEGVPFDAGALRYLARGADGSMRDGLSLLDQAIAFGGGEVREGDVRSMLGVAAHDRAYKLLEAVASLDGKAVMGQVAELAELAPDFEGLLGELVGLLHRVALAQVVPGIPDEGGGDGEALARLAGLMSPEDVQLFYQVALIGQRDLPLAPDPRAGFEMVLLRMLAFRPGEPAPASNAPSNRGGRKRAPAGNAAASGGGQGSAPARTGASTGGVREPAPPRPAPAKKTGAEPPTAGEGGDVPDLSRWHEVVERLKLGGLTRQLANNCSFAGCDGRVLRLALDPAHGNLRAESTVQRLSKALEALVGQPLKLQIDAEAAGEATPAQREARRAAKRQLEAEAAISDDPLVRALDDAFGAKVVPGSVRPRGD